MFAQSYKKNIETQTTSNKYQRKELKIYFSAA